MRYWLQILIWKLRVCWWLLRSRKFIYGVELRNHKCAYGGWYKFPNPRYKVTLAITNHQRSKETIYRMAKRLTIVLRDEWGINPPPPRKM